MEGEANLATGKYRCTKVEVYPVECSQKLERDPSNNVSCESLVLKSAEGTLWDPSLPVSLTLWDTLMLCTPPLPFCTSVKMEPFVLLALSPVL